MRLSDLVRLGDTSGHIIWFYDPRFGDLWVGRRKWHIFVTIWSRMAPRKRPRRSLKVKTFEVIDKEGAQSTIRQDPVGFYRMQMRI